MWYSVGEMYLFCRLRTCVVYLINFENKKFLFLKNEHIFSITQMGDFI